MFQVVRLIACACLFTAVAASEVRAEIPAVKMISAPGISPAAAWTYYTRASVGPDDGPTVRTNSFAAWSASPPEIKALAQSLGAKRIAATGTPAPGQITGDDYTQAVFAYVRNNIDVEFRFGLGKGARGAVLDQSGTPFDQADLMVALLREGNVTAQYSVGTMTLTAEQFGFWTGLVYGLNETNQTFSVDARAACRFLADGAIPLAIGGTSDCDQVSGPLANITVGHAWVVVNGQAYNPSIKAGVLKNPKDVAAMMGCGGSCGQELAGLLMGGVESGTYSTDVPYYKNLNMNAVYPKLAERSVALQHSLQTTDRRLPVVELLGGETRTLAPTVGAAQNRWGLAEPGLTLEPSLSGLVAVPNRLRTSVRLQYRFAQSSSGFTGVDVTMFADEIAGRRVVMVKANDPNGPPPHMLLDGMRFERNCACNTPSLDVNHPYASNGGAYGDDSISLSETEQGSRGMPPGPVVLPQVGTGTTTLLFGMGESSMSAQQAMSELQSSNPMIPDGRCSQYVYPSAIYKSCRNDSQPAIALAVQAQSTLLRKVAAGVTGSMSSRHHDIGLVYASRADINHRSLVTMQTVMSVTNKTGDAAARQRAHEITAAMLPMVEAYAVADPTDPTDTIASPIGFRLANGQGGKAIYVTTPVQMSGLSTNYFSGVTYQPMADAGYSFIGAEGSEGQLFYKPASGTYGTAAIAYLLWNGAKGGGAPSAPDVVKGALGTLNVADQATARRKALGVSMSDGALTLTSGPDIVSGAGNFPWSLPFVRTYVGGGVEREETYLNDIYRMSDASQFQLVPSTSLVWVYSGPDQEVFGRLGGGWTHNYAISATYTGNTARVLGSNTAIEASSTIATAVALNQLFSRSDPYDGSIETFQGRLAAIAVVNGWSFGLFRNSVVLRNGAATETFQRLADGSFFAGGTSPATLVQTGEPSWFSGYTTYGAVQFLYTGGDGSKIRFDWAFRPHYNTNIPVEYARVSPQFKALDWVFPNGIRIDFEYTLKTVTPTLPLQPISWGFGGGPTVYARSEGYVLTAVRNNLGRRLDFTVSPYQGTPYHTMVGYKITSVSDESNRRVSFSLSCDTLLCGQFTVTDPDNKVTRYDYAPNAYSPNPATLLSSGYRLRQWFTAQQAATPYQQVAYDELFRVRAVRNALGAETVYLPGGVAGSESWKVGVVVSGAKQVVTTVLNENNAVLRSILGAGTEAIETVNTYDERGRKIRSRMPEGQVEEFEYDVRDNAIQTCLIPKGVTRSCSQTAGDLVTFATFFEGTGVWPCANVVVCNQMTSKTDARGFVTEYGWNATTGDLSWFLQPADIYGLRPRMDLGYGSYVGVGGASFQMLTSTTKAVTASRNATTTYAYDAANKFVLKEAVSDSTGLALRSCFGYDAIGNLISVTDPRATGCPQ